MIADATSAVFAMDMPWSKLDVVTWSWQKAMGGEAAHGMLVLSPRAVERLETYTPSWPMPKIFRLTKKGKVDRSIFEGDTINTPSMLCAEDALDGLKWAEQLGGLSALIQRSEDNLAAIAAWVERSEWAGFLAEDPATRSNTSVCLKIVDSWFVALSESEQAQKSRKLYSSWRRKTLPTTSLPIVMRLQASEFGLALPSSVLTLKLCCPGLTGPMLK